MTRHEVSGAGPFAVGTTSVSWPEAAQHQAVPLGVTGGTGHVTPAPC